MSLTIIGWLATGVFAISYFFRRPPTLRDPLIKSHFGGAASDTIAQNPQFDPPGCPPPSGVDGLAPKSLYALRLAEARVGKTVRNLPTVRRHLHLAGQFRGAHTQRLQFFSEVFAGMDRQACPGLLSVSLLSVSLLSVS
jgi:hypothetical protein